MHKLCIWMCIPSHHQSAFFDALALRNDIDLQVRYFRGAESSVRVSEGFSCTYEYRPHEKCVEGFSGVHSLLSSVPDWDSRVHVISRSFSPLLVDYFCAHKVQWCHWSECSGISLGEKLKWNTSLFRLLNPVALKLKAGEGALMRNHALGAFGQGSLARHSFREMGVPNEMIEDLYYVSSALPNTVSAEQILTFARGRRAFLSVAALCRRKGTDVLLKSFSKLRTDNWCLILTGVDRANGAFQELAERLGLKNQVLFLGAYPVDRIAEVYAASDVFVLPSRFDGWGVVFNEAASLGIPLIGTDLCGAAWHLIKSGVNGFRVKAGSISSLTHSMQKYVDHLELIDQHGMASKELFYREFTPEKNTERLVLALDKWNARS